MDGSVFKVVESPGISTFRSPTRKTNSKTKGVLGKYILCLEYIFFIPLFLF